MGLGLGLGVISRLPAPSLCPPLGDGPSACRWASSAASVRWAGHAAHNGQHTHGSGECMGEEAWRMYWVHWNTRKARLARKSRADSRPATGRSWKPVRSARAMGGGQLARQVGGGHRAVHPRALPSGGRTLQEAGDVLQLGDVVCPVTTGTLQQLESLQVLPAGVGGIEAPESGVHLLPAGRGHALRPPGVAPSGGHPALPLLACRPWPLGGAFACDLGDSRGPGGGGQPSAPWDKPPTVASPSRPTSGVSESTSTTVLSLLEATAPTHVPRALRIPASAPPPLLSRGLTRWQFPRLCTPHGE